MGILNVTPDSFSDGGVNFSIGDAVESAKQMVADGVDIIDVGGESTRPGSESITVEEELRRVIPVIQKIKNLGVPISIDSYKLEVVEKAFDAGASMLNDVYGLRTLGMPELAAKHDVPVVIMHMQGMPISMQENPKYDNVVGDIKKFFEKQVDVALKAGVKKENIILDPGIGFGKTLGHNLEILKNIKEFKTLCYPILVGHSRKRFIGDILEIPVEERGPATLAISTYLALQGVDYIRVHDVRETVEMRKILEAVSYENV
ncbi:MAG TPA: dihydropteroate synthase [Candidatus Altiarchaeales archaeon]|nr:dihydropteroate synthase [Candidatus Altiarchaeales archaeon]